MRTQNSHLSYTEGAARVIIDEGKEGGLGGKRVGGIQRDRASRRVKVMYLWEAKRFRWTEINEAARSAS